MLEQVLTSALEFLPGFTSIILTGHIDSPYTKQYVDAATLSTMVSTPIYCLLWSVPC